MLGDDYVAADRLRVLDAVYGVTSRALLEGAGLREGMTCVDVGCGTGWMTLAIATKVGPAGHTVGVDKAGLFLEQAQQYVADDPAIAKESVSFVHGTADDLPLVPSSFDFIYARCLLSHLTDPLRALTKMAALARPGGIVCVEDIDCGGVFAHPETPALMRHQALYQSVTRRYGGDPLMGRKLPRLYRKAGLSDVKFQIVRPTEPADAVKRLYPLTLACLKPAIVDATLASAAEVDSIIAQLHALADEPTRKMTATPMVQVWARKA